MPKYNTKVFIEAIKESGGIISTIADRVGCEWRTAKKWIDNYPSVLLAYNDECERVNDYAESTIVKSLKSGDLVTSKWWIGRKRSEGFAEKHELQIEYVNDWRNNVED